MSIIPVPDKGKELVPINGGGKAEFLLVTINGKVITLIEENDRVFINEKNIVEKASQIKEKSFLKIFNATDNILLKEQQRFKVLFKIENELKSSIEKEAEIMKEMGANKEEIAKCKHQLHTIERTLTKETKILEHEIEAHQGDVEFLIQDINQLKYDIQILQQLINEKNSEIENFIRAIQKQKSLETLDSDEFQEERTFNDTFELTHQMKILIEKKEEFEKVCDAKIKRLPEMEEKLRLMKAKTDTMKAEKATVEKLVKFEKTLDHLEKRERLLERELVDYQIKSLIFDRLQKAL